MGKKPERLHVDELLHLTPKQTEARKQALAHRYTLYGGAMAGGKSYWLRWMLVYLLLRWAAAGLTKVEVGLFCEDYPTLKDRQLSKIGSEFPSWLGTLHQDHATHGRCYILAPDYGGGIIKFRNLDDPSKYQSAEFAAIAVDELTKNEKSVFDDLRNRLRWPGISDIKFLASTNPGGVGHAWVKKLWLDRVFEENETEPEQFHYVRALAQDNPHIDPSYLKQLESLPTDKRRAYLEGDWDIFKGQYFTEFRREVHVIKPFTIPDDWKRFRMGDYGFNAPSAVYWGAISPDGQLFLYRELYRSGLSYSALVDEVSALTSPTEDIAYDVFDPAIWSRKGENDAGLSGAEIMQNRYKELKKKNLNLIKGDNDRLNGWAMLREYLKPYHFNGQLTARLQIFDTCTELIRTLPALIYDQHRTEDVDTDGDDHGPDAVRYGVMSRPKPAITSVQKEDALFRAKMKQKKARQLGSNLIFS